MDVNEFNRIMDFLVEEMDKVGNEIININFEIEKIYSTLKHHNFNLEVLKNRQDNLDDIRRTLLALHSTDLERSRLDQWFKTHPNNEVYHNATIQFFKEIIEPHVIWQKTVHL